MRARVVMAMCLAALLLLVAAPAQAQVQVNVAFTPTNVAPTGTSVLAIDLINNSAAPATAVTLNTALPGSPAGLSFDTGALVSNSCGGTVSAPAGGTALSLSGGSIAASSGGTPGICRLELRVRANPPSPPATYTFTITPAQISSSIGGGAASASATLSVLPVNALTGALTVSVANIHGLGTPVRLRLQINNSNPYAVTGVAFSNTLPTQLEFAAVPNATSSCGGTLTLAPGGTSWSLSGGTIAASSNCVIQVDFVPRNSTTIPADGNASISLPIGAITSTQGASNAAAISRSIRVQKAASVTAVFSPSAITAGQTSTHTITLNNFNGTAISGFSFTDAMPAGVTIAGGTSTTCGGTLSFTATSITLSGGTLPAAPSGIGSASCTISMTVTAPANGNYSNSIPAGSIGGVSYNSTTAALLVSSVSVAKAFSPASVPTTGTSTLTITLTNRTVGTAATITSLTDALTTMGSGFTISASVPRTTTCGGTLNAPVGGTSIVLNGGAIPAATSTSSHGTCTVTVGVDVGTAAPTGNRTNSIAVNGLRTSQGNNLVSATARLTVGAPLTVSKTFAATTTTTSTVVRLTITVTRAAYAGLMTNVAVTDNLPSGFTVAPTPSAATTCTGATMNAVPGATTVSLSGGSLGTTLASSASCTFAVNVLTPATSGTYTNTIAVGQASATTPTGSVSNLTAASRAITIVDGVTITTGFSPISVTPGAISRLRIVISNPASLATTLTSAALTDLLPAGLEIAAVPNATILPQAGSCSGTLTALPGGNSFALSGGTLGAGSLCELSVDVTPTAVGSLVNTIPAGALTNAQGRSNMSPASATLISSGNADVVVTKTDGVTSVIAGNSSTYTITVTNSSTVLTVAGLDVTDDEPDDLSFTAWTCSASSGSSCTAASGSGSLALAVTLTPGGVATIMVTARVDPASERTSIANVVSVDPAAAGVFDPVTANNSATDTNSITTSADLAVTKISSIASPAVGGSTDFVVTVANAGPSVARDVAASDALPAGYTLDAAVVSQGSFADPAWTIGDLAPGASVTLTMTVTVNASGPYANTATVTATTTDPDSMNNSVTITPLNVALTVGKSSSVLSDPFNGAANPKRIPGAIVRYDILLQNSGTAAIDADTLVITDVLPVGMAVRVTDGASPGVTLIDGSPASGLSLAWPGGVQWTDNPGGAGPYDYVPSPDGQGFDAAVTGLRVTLSGAMAGGTAASPREARVTYSARIE